MRRPMITTKVFHISVRRPIIITKVFYISIRYAIIMTKELASVDRGLAGMVMMMTALAKGWNNATGTDTGTCTGSVD
jgi:hypothetical protein